MRPRSVSPATFPPLWAALLVLGGCDRADPAPAQPAAAGAATAGESTPRSNSPWEASAGASAPAAAGGAPAPAQSATAGAGQGGHVSHASPEAGAAADGGSTASETPQVAALTLALEKVASCDAVAELVREGALVDMNAQLDAAFDQHLTGNDCVVFDEPSLPSGAPSSGAPTSAGPNAVSTTNNQVANVDEADFVKNDDRFIYTVGNGALRIIAAWPAAETREVGRASISGKPVKLFVLGDRAVVYVSVPRSNDAPQEPGFASPSACTYGYNCRFEGDGSDTALLVFDIADRSAPKLLRRLDVTGSLIAARRIESAIHSVVATPNIAFPYSTWPEGLQRCKTPTTDTQKQAAKQAFEALRVKNAELIRTTPLPSVLPSVRIDGAALADFDCGRVYRAGGGGSAFTSLLSFDLNAADAPLQATIVSRPGVVYASPQTLYLAVPQEAPAASPWFEGVNEREVTTIHAFDIGKDPALTDYRESGFVKGRVLNQFALDEHAGYLRVATTSGHLPNPDAHNTLSVLGHGEATLALLGQIDDIAKGEDIRSVRFDGERGFMVTFKKTDPLYAFDLKDPRQPKILGELKIPGFSTYIHLLDKTHLLTIGYDAMDHGDFAFFDGVLLQIFDVSNLASPTLAHKTSIGTRGSSSEALADHLAFNLFQGKLALPMTICEGGGDGSYGTDMTFSGLIVYDVSIDTGFKERGRVANPQGADGQYDDSLCSNWWTNAQSEVKRSVFMDDFVYAITPSVLRVQDTRAMGKDLAAVQLAP